ncbi:hypothetical protein [Lignipirellula cremea]|uniref:hypothetical protein n=1 Tax=Lignipirellula cremea TaxID=2528010 RepID=UPI0011A9D53A|nr:hypothetical protein [Lignipirellula cremea]
MSLSSNLREYIAACFTGLWIESHEHPDALAEIAQLCRDESWRLAVWGIERGLQIAGQDSSEVAGGDPLAAIRSINAVASPDSSALFVLQNFHRYLSSPEVIQTVARQVIEGRQTRAERQYNHVDPENRLIAASLERRWEQALDELEQARRLLRDLESGPPPAVKVSARDRKAFSDVGKQLPGMWNDLAIESRKALLRTLVMGVNLDRGDEGKVTVRLVWRGGLVTEVERQVPIHSRRYSELEERVVNRVRELNETGASTDAIISCLNKEGFIPCRGGEFTTAIIMKLKQRYGIISNLESLRQGNQPANKYTAEQIAAEVGVKREWIYRKISRGIIRIEKNSLYGCYLFPRTKQAVRELRRLKEGKCAHVSF